MSHNSFIMIMISEYLNLGNNFFVGTLGEYMLYDLKKLKYFNVSNNELTSPIPSVHNNASSITHFDISTNRFYGTVPSSIMKMTEAVHLNLQGNWITGVVPDEMNNLNKLDTLALSHDLLANLQKLYLHRNQFTGEAPYTNRELNKYITDCGFPSTSLKPLTCPSCNVCCNAENLCSKQSKTALQPTTIGTVFFFVIFVSMAIIYFSKSKIVRSRSLRNFFEEVVATWVPAEMLAEKSVYHFFLTQNTRGKIQFFIIYVY